MRNPHTPDCAIDACSRAADKSGLCTKHHALVPLGMRQSSWIEGVTAAREIAKRHHREWAAYVQELVDDVRFTLS
jgi:hypothetical protein